MKYIVQYAALAMAMLSGTGFLSGVLRLLGSYDYTHHRFAPTRVSPSETLFAGVACVAFARIYQLVVRAKSDPISKIQTQIEVLHVGFLGAWFCFLFMVYKMNLPDRGVSSWVLPVIAFVAACTVAAGSRMRKQYFARSSESLRDDVGKALGFWKGANIVSFTHAMSLAILGAVLKFLGTRWLMTGVFFGASLGLLVLWRPRQMAHVSLKTEVYHLTTDELLKRMPKEQAITLVQGHLRRMEESLNDPDIPAAKIRMEKVLEELKRS